MNDDGMNQERGDTQDRRATSDNVWLTLRQAAARAARFLKAPSSVRSIEDAFGSPALVAAGP